MKNTSKIAMLALTGAVAAVSAEAMDMGGDKSSHEKCYGVAKAGQNDCGTSSHSCAGQAAADADKSEWVYVPKGLCAKLAGGSLESE